MQVAATLSCVVLGSAVLFAYHCASSQIWLAGMHPPLMYGLLILLLLPVPLRFLFQVCAHPTTSTVCRDFLLLHQPMCLQAWAEVVVSLAATWRQHVSKPKDT